MDAPFQDHPKTQAQVVLKEGWSLVGVQFHVNLKSRFLKRRVGQSLIRLVFYKYIPKPRTSAQHKNVWLLLSNRETSLTMVNKLDLLVVVNLHRVMLWVLEQGCGNLQKIVHCVACHGKFLASCKFRQIVSNNKISIVYMPLSSYLTHF